LTDNVKVFVIEDDAATRDSIAALIDSVGMEVQVFGTADEFLEQYDEQQPGCLVLDIRLPGTSGVQLQEILIRRGIDLPIIMMSGYGTIPMAVRAVKAGAFDFLEKPFRDQEFIDRVQQAVRHDLATRDHRHRKGQIAALMSGLTTRERQVLDKVVAGNSNKEIADSLGLSHKTIEYHRSKIMEKLKVENVAELVHVTLLARQ
jgi:FixJ family two-component response regulator